MNKRIKAFFSMGVVSVFQILLNIVRSKLTAVILGTYGIGLISVINNILGIGQTASNLGINNGIVKKVSDNTSDKEEVENVISTSYITSLISSVIILILMVIFAKQISNYNFNNEGYYKYIIIIAISIPISTFNTIDTAIINGFKEIEVISRVSILTAILNVVSSVLLIYFLKIDGAIYSIVAMAVCGYIMNFFALKYVLKKNDIKFKITLSGFRKKIFRMLVGFGATNIFALLFSNFAMLIIKIAITKRLGMDSNGIFQADWAIMSQYIGIVFSSCGIYYFPTLCSLKSDKERVVEMNKTLEMLLLVIVPLFMGILVFKDVIITLLYSSKFILAAELLAVFIIGDFFKVIAWTLGFVFAPIYRLKAFVVIDLFSNLLFAVSSILLLNKFGNLYGIAYAYVVLNVSLCVIYYIYLKNNMKFEFKSYAKKNMVISFAVLAGSCGVMELLNIGFAYKLIAVLLMFGVWAKLIIDKEKLEKIRNFVNSKLKRKS